jgi:hypothetical protein
MLLFSLDEAPSSPFKSGCVLAHNKEGGEARRMPEMGVQFEPLLKCISLARFDRNS